MTLSVPAGSKTNPLVSLLTLYGPGIALSAAVAIVAVLAAPLVGRFVTIPAMVIALLIGIALHPVAARPVFQPGMIFCVKKLLRIAVALLGIRIALADIAALGASSILLVVTAMAVTLISGFLLARLFGQNASFGALAGAATAVCGASATLATGTVVPNYKGKEADIAFVVVAVNALSTVAMVLYPALCVWLGFDAHVTGVVLGSTIHDVAQVVGAGYAVSQDVGNTAVVVKLFRVFLLLPVVLAVGWYFTSRGAEHGEAKVPVPVFALVFLALCVVNSVLSVTPLAPIYLPVKAVLSETATWGLLIAIGALGLGTSVSAMAKLGYRHILTVSGTTAVILAIAIGWELALR